LNKMALVIKHLIKHPFWFSFFKYVQEITSSLFLRTMYNKKQHLKKKCCHLFSDSIGTHNQKTELTRGAISDHH